MLFDPILLSAAKCCGLIEAYICLLVRAEKITDYPKLNAAASLKHTSNVRQSDIHLIIRS